METRRLETPVQVETSTVETTVQVETPTFLLELKNLRA